METTMQKAFLTIFGAILIAAMTAHVAAAAERHAHKARATTSEQFRNSNAYFAAPNDFAVRSYGGSNQGEAAISGAIAGH
jgi:hypothetical protein